jgi:DNA-binding PadR family transcriptional regulator
MFAQGDLKYVILQMLAEKPRHGYEIIKDLEERFRGAYSPSAGTVYPTLTLLEDMGYARATVDEGGRKVYSITNEGQQYLEKNRGVVDELFERIADFGASFLSDPMMEVNRAFGRLVRTTYTQSPWSLRDPDVASKVKAILDEATGKVGEVIK